MTSSALDRDRVTAWLLQEVPALAPAWLRDQRWYGGKGKTIDRVAVEEVLWLPDPVTASALIVLGLQYANPTAATAVHRERYASVVAVDDGGGGPALGHLPWAGLRVVEALATEPAIRALLGGLHTGEPVRGVRGGEVVYGDVSSRARHLLTTGPDNPPPIVAVGLEQSNTSVRVGSTHVFKLFRRLEEGDHPQLEMGRFLSRVGFRSAPPLEGSLEYRPSGGRGCALGALEGWLDNEGDGWRYAVTRLERAASEGSEPEDVAESLFGLGTTTADFHVALASDPDTAAFAPEPVVDADRRAWHDQVLQQAERTFDLVQRHHGSWDPSTAALAASALGARDHVAHRLARRGVVLPDAFQKIRIHGDFHLGQTLKTREGFAIIDFEGEPTKPLDTRRQKQCALRDVAGMLRSIEYAVATVWTRQSRPATEASPAGRVRDAFLEGYRLRARAQGAPFLPSTPAACDAWIAFFELEKTLYEIEYEVNNRPSWAHIPLRALGRLVTGTG